MRLTTMRYYLCGRKAFLMLFFAVSYLSWGGCSREETYPTEKELPAGAHVFLSFAVRSGISEDAARANSRGLTNDAVQTGEKEGSTPENRINNLWVLLYTKGSSNYTSTLKYKFSFTFDGVNNHYTDDSGKIAGPSAPHNTYRTSSKLVEPGTYRIVTVANTKIKFVNHSAYQMQDNAMKDIRNQELDIIGDLAIPGRSGIANYAALTASTSQFVGVNCGEEFPRNDKELTESGILAYYTDDNFVIDREYNTPDNPIVRPMGLKRWLSKIRMTITNLDIDGNIYPDAAGYKLKSFQVKNYYNSNKFFEWDMHNYGSHTGYDTANLVGIPEFPADKFPVLHQLSTDGFVAGTPVPETELFNHYITGYNDALPPETEDNCQSVRLIFTQTSTGKDFQYDIPLYNQEGVQRPPYISATSFSKYTILRNTLYELRVVFKGPSLGVMGLTYELKDYIPTVVDFPSFE